MPGKDARPCSGAAERGARALAPFARRSSAGVAALALAASAGAFPASAPASSPAGATTYQLDPAHTFVTFEVRHFGTSTLRGRIGPVNGEVDLDRVARTGDLRLRIPAGTLDTGIAALDARLKAPDLLATKEYPEAYFLATQFHFDADGGVKEVRGEFILRGISQPLSLFAQRFACRQDERLKREVCGGDFEATLKRGDFGANFGEPFVGDAVRLVVQVEGISAR